MEYTLAFFTVIIIALAGNALEGTYILWPALLGFACAMTRDLATKE